MNGIAGCIAGIDPLFAGASDYRLQDGSSAFGETISPAVDAGITRPWMRDATDLDGNRRVNGSRRNLGRLVDIGAYETEGVAASLFLVR